MASRTGVVLGTAGFLGRLLAGPGAPYPVPLFVLTVTGLGQTMTALAAVATAVFTVSRQVGSAVGVALFGTFTAAAHDFVTGLRLSAGSAPAAFAAGALLTLSLLRRTRGTLT
jgi:DHA2 family methylenomycin A resistance protein-like MFS transporter